MDAPSIDWIAIDWGTSNVRAWGIGTHGKIVFERQSADGMGTLQPGDYAKALTSLLQDAIPKDMPPLDLIVCGMAGARQGWLEAPYLEAPANLRMLGTHAAIPPLDDTRFNPRILAGVCQKTPGSEDVMRGEETQILGFLDQNPDYAGLICMPGTHSKWVTVEDFAILKFNTVMTGELYATIKQNTVLRHTTGSDDTEPEGFSAGLQKSFEAPELLTSNLFSVRAAGLLSGRSPAWLSSYLSGLLIGAEIGVRKDLMGSGVLPLIGASRLCRLYAHALDELGIQTQIIDAKPATLAGLSHAKKSLK